MPIRRSRCAAGAFITPSGATPTAPPLVMLHGTTGPARTWDGEADARLVEVPNAGHTVPGDQPAAFLALITDFLNA
jgi:pimeloyl-ACP methyl ester carboxylesterase